MDILIIILLVGIIVGICRSIYETYAAYRDQFR